MEVQGHLFFYCTFLVFVCGLWIAPLGLVYQYDVCTALYVRWQWVFFNKMGGLLYVILHVGLRKLFIEYLYDPYKRAWVSERGSLDSGADFSQDHRKHLRLRTLQKILLESSPCQMFAGVLAVCLFIETMGNELNRRYNSSQGTQSQSTLKNLTFIKIISQ